MLYKKLEALHISHLGYVLPFLHLGLKLYCAFAISLGTTISPWIVTLDALKPFTCEAPKQVRKWCI